MNGDDKLHSILPLLRPRSAEPTLFTQVVWYLFWVGIAVLLALYIRRWLSHRRQRTREFQAAANAAGLTAEQTELLYSIARQQKMKSPPRLLSSPQVFDRQAGAYADIVVARNRHDPELAAIGQIRAALDFDDLDLEQSMSSTRQIDRGQTVMISVDRDTAEDELLYPWLVLERDEGALTLAPVLRAKGEPDLELRLGEEVTARFWREGDTEYQFVTKVLRRSRTEHSLDVRHASVEREQNRDFYRIDVDFPADFLLMSMQDPPAEGGAGVHSDAAINLLDLEGSETIRIDDSEDTGEDQEAGTTDV